MHQCFVNQNAHKTVNMVVLFVNSNENTYPKGRAPTQMYRVVPITKRGNSLPDQRGSSNASTPEHIYLDSWVPGRRTHTGQETLAVLY